MRTCSKIAICVSQTCIRYDYVGKEIPGVLRSAEGSNGVIRARILPYQGMYVRSVNDRQSEIFCFVNMDIEVGTVPKRVSDNVYTFLYEYPLRAQVHFVRFISLCAHLPLEGMRLQLTPNLPLLLAANVKETRGGLSREERGASHRRARRRPRSGKSLASAVQEARRGAERRQGDN